MLTLVRTQTFANTCVSVSIRYFSNRNISRLFELMNGNNLSKFRTKLNETQTKYLKGFSHQLNREYSKQKGVARVDAFPAFWAQNSIR